MIFKRHRKHIEKVHAFWNFAWKHFLGGTFQGIGFLFGSALVLTVFTTILHAVIGEIPFFSDFARAVEVWLDVTLKART